MIKCIGISKIYSTGNNIVKAIDNTDLELNSNELVCLVGPSGSGKTTLLNVMCGLDCVDKGDIFFEDKKITELSQKELDEFRRKNVGIVFQSFNLLEEYNVYDNVALPLRILGVDKETIRSCVLQSLKCVNLENYEKRKISELSGGQKQRVAIARAIVKKPQILFLDEPTGNLDESNTIAIFELIKQISKNCLVVVVSHDIKNACGFADKIINIVDGKLDSVREGNGHHKKITKISICDLNNEKIYIAKESESINDLINRIVEVYDKKDVKLKLSVDVNRSDSEESQLLIKPNDFQCSSGKAGLSLLDKVRLSLFNYRVQKVRLIITFLLFVFTSTYALLMYTVSTYDHKESLISYIQKQNIQEVEIYKTSEYVNIFGETVTEQTNVGENLINTISSAIDKKYITKTICIEELANGDLEERASYITAKVINSENDNYYKVVLGKLPQDEKEIVLSDYLALVLFPNVEFNEVLGKTVLNIDVNFTVCGIVESGCFEDKGIVDSDTLMSKYGFAILNEKYIESFKKQPVINVSAGDITCSNSLSSYVSSNAYICSIEDIEPSLLIAGRMPNNKNEVLISSYLADHIGFEYESLCEITYSLLDIKSGQYNGAYDKINLYDLFPSEKVHIVGVFEAENTDMFSYANIALDETIFNEICEKHGLYYCYNAIYVRCEDVTEVIRQFDLLDVKINENGCQTIYMFKDTIENIQSFLYVLLALSVAIFIFFLVSYVSYSISDRSKQIGIMRSFGIPKKNIVAIFVINIILLSFATIPIVIGGFGGLIGYLNQVFDSHYMNNIGFDIIVVNKIAIFIIELIVLALSYIFSLIPILNMSKRSPNELLNK
ncbi:MAG: ATP-binding cassette domain-containing protein [Ruminococcaceae bacterium]|nr:ATP-binding cassette domain-containing protein [Oscillospiraceae bacterium]